MATWRRTLQLGQLCSFRVNATTRRRRHWHATHARHTDATTETWLAEMPRPSVADARGQGERGGRHGKLPAWLPGPSSQRGSADRSCSRCERPLAQRSGRSAANVRAESDAETMGDEGAPSTLPRLVVAPAGGADRAVVLCATSILSCASTSCVMPRPGFNTLIQFDHACQISLGPFPRPRARMTELYDRAVTANARDSRSRSRPQGHLRWRLDRRPRLLWRLADCQLPRGDVPLAPPCVQAQVAKPPRARTKIRTVPYWYPTAQDHLLVNMPRTVPHPEGLPQEWWQARQGGCGGWGGRQGDDEEP